MREEIDGLSIGLIIGLLIGAIIAFTVCTVNYEPIVRCTDGLIKGYTLIWDKEEYPKEWCRVETLIDGNVVLLKVTDYEKMLK